MSQLLISWNKFNPLFSNLDGFWHKNIPKFEMNLVIAVYTDILAHGDTTRSVEIHFCNITVKANDICTS